MRYRSLDNYCDPFRIKQSTFCSAADDSKKVVKATRYFRRLTELGLFENYSLNGKRLLQERKKASNCFLGFGTTDCRRNLGYFAFTSTENSLNRAINKVDSGAESTPSVVDTISGMCLFGSGVDLAFTRNKHVIPVVEIGSSTEKMKEGVHEGDSIVDIQIEDSISLYEFEKTARLTHFLNGLSGPAAAGKAYLVTPRLQYYLYLMPLFEQGRITSDLMTKWFDAVDSRDRLIRSEFYQASTAGVEFVENSLRPAEGMIRRAVAKRAVVERAEIVSRLAADSEYWELLLKCEPPRSWKHLINLSYIASFMREANKSPRHLLVHLDDQVERVLLSETARLKKRLKKHSKTVEPIVGIYLLQWLIDQDPSRDSDIYTHRPATHELTSARTLIDRIAGQGSEPEGMARPRSSERPFEECPTA